MPPGQIHEHTEAELEILQVLWEKQPATVKEVHEELRDTREVGYTTILKQMQRMFDKGMLQRTKEGKTHLYTAVAREQEVQRSMFDRLVDTAFRGSAMKMFMHALGQSRINEADLEQLQEWIAQQKEEE
ncbi:BlaI/MecI/CopY family transcriptional regulator [Flavilitoribacter nigricans]|uniref:Transcriptional regulator n=1 Tax=Flavilitoribacter nigricans (strain ATCC 23147 / DSM 23189 / NBRC 102662 / NCIMB 1420 / SS-2) TaxID=1122177 RepID=A0A2D0NGY1_FLAN2|nr:BlaI/MecI/CopY family transcriptional regulator [Flavilitoribacter nigricans]PHN07640.1 transcriptional regulator [Flavilitoribacter nigricans DSM 23189 = NBRC 102662]